VRVESPSLRDRVYELRYRAYRSNASIPESEQRRFSDRFDDQPNHVLWAIVEGTRIVASLRTTWYDPKLPDLRTPEQEAYSDDLTRAVPAGIPLVSGNRLVTEPERNGRSRVHVMALLRQYMVVAECHRGWSICAVRRHHTAFYQRVLCMRVLGPERPYPGLTCGMHLMGESFVEQADLIYRNHPELVPTAADRMLTALDKRDKWEVGNPIHRPNLLSLEETVR